jgi:hypothetical protein
MASHYDLFGDSTLQWKLALVGAVIGLTLVIVGWASNSPSAEDQPVVTVSSANLPFASSGSPSG